MASTSQQSGERKKRQSRPKLVMDDLATQIMKSTAGENYEEVCIKNVFNRIKFESTHIAERPQAYDSDISKCLPIKIVENLGKMNVQQLLPTQRYTLPLLVDHDTDLFVGAATGHGKTLGFLIPVVVSLLADPRTGSSSKRPRVLVISNTQVLQIQTFKVCQSLIAGTDLRAVLVCGEAHPKEQQREIEQGVDILIATTGRLKDFLKKKVVELDDLKFYVYDEADKMTQFGAFRDEVRDIDAFIPKEIKPKIRSCFFTATLDSIHVFDGMFRTEKMSMIQVPGNPLITHQIIPLNEKQDNDKEKSLLLMKLLMKDVKMQGRTLFDKSSAPYLHKTVVFVGEKMRCSWLGAYLRPYGFSVGIINSDYSLAMRNRVIQRFIKGEIQALIATDSMARGHDIPNVTHVINFDVADNALDTFKHRAGRTARIGHKGTCTTLLSRSQFMLYDNPMISEMSAPRKRAAELARYLIVECGQRVPKCLMGPARVGLKMELAERGINMPVEQFIEEATTLAKAMAKKEKSRNVPTEAAPTSAPVAEAPQPTTVSNEQVEFDEDDIPCFEEPDSNEETIESEAEEEEAEEEAGNDESDVSVSEAALVENDAAEVAIVPAGVLAYDEDEYFMGEELSESDLQADSSHMIAEYSVREWTSDEETEETAKTENEDTEEDRLRALQESFGQLLEEEGEADNLDDTLEMN